MIAAGRDLTAQTKNRTNRGPVQVGQAGATTRLDNVIERPRHGRPGQANKCAGHGVGHDRTGDALRNQEKRGEHASGPVSWSVTAVDRQHAVVCQGDKPIRVMRLWDLDCAPSSRMPAVGWDEEHQRYLAKRELARAKVRERFVKHPEELVELRQKRLQLLDSSEGWFGWMRHHVQYSVETFGLTMVRDIPITEAVLWLVDDEP